MEEKLYLINVKGYNINPNKILYIMADEGKTSVFFDNFEKRFEMPLKEWFDYLDARVFVKCHRSCIVNMKNVYEINKKNSEIIMNSKSKDKLVISRRLKSDVISRYTSLNIC